MSKEEAERVTRDMSLLPERLEDGKVLAPVEEGERIASITLRLDGEIVYIGDLLAAADVDGRSFETDAVYHLDRFIGMAFSPMGALISVGGIVAVFAAIRVAVVLRKMKHRRKNPYRFVKNRRRY
jgi:hypothetical protein